MTCRAGGDAGAIHVRAREGTGRGGRAGAIRDGGGVQGCHMVEPHADLLLSRLLRYAGMYSTLDRSVDSSRSSSSNTSSSSISDSCAMTLITPAVRAHMHSTCGRHIHDRCDQHIHGRCDRRMHAWGRTYTTLTVDRCDQHIHDRCGRDMHIR